MNQIKPIFICFISLLFAGCFVRIPTTSNEEMNKNVGKFGIMNRDMTLNKYYMSKSACDLEDQIYLKEKHFIRKLKKGTKIEIKSVAYRRLPHGVIYYYICKDIKNNDVFEIHHSKLEAMDLDIIVNRQIN